MEDIVILMASHISSFEIMNVVIPDLKTYFWIVASVADAAAVVHNDIKILLANSFRSFSIKGKLVFDNSPRSLPRSPPTCTILGN